MISFSQLDKNTFLVGGSGSFNKYNLEQQIIPTNDDKVKIKITKFEISTKVGYFISDKFVLGIIPTYSIEKEFSENSGKTTKNIFLIGPFVRYYLLTKEKQFNILTEFNYQLGILNINYFGDNKADINKLSFFVGPEFFFNSVIGAEILFGYKKYNQIFDNKNYTSLNESGFQILIGFQIHLFK